MSNEFRIEKHTDEVSERLIKIYAKDNSGIPIKIDLKSRFGVIEAHAEKHLDRIHNFEVRSDDVWVITNPKSGSNWMCELLWLLVNNFDFETALQVDQEIRYPFLDLITVIPGVSSIDDVKNSPSPRVILSHLPIHILPKDLWTIKPKMVFVTRDPKDACVSYFHFLSGMGYYQGNKEDFIRFFLEDKLIFSPFWMLAAEFWKLRNEDFVYFTSFERMKRDLRLVVLDLCKFFGKTISDEQMEKLLEHLSFKNMKQNKAVNKETVLRKVQDHYGVEDKSFQFLRKGEVNSHKEEYSEATIQKFEDWTKKCLEPYGFTAEEILLS